MLESLIIEEKLVLALGQVSGNAVIPLFAYTPYFKSGYRLINESLKVSELKAISWITSLEEVEFPVFALTDTESKQLLTAINLEWTSPRIQLDILFQIPDSEFWQKIASYSVLNPAPFPYREFALGTHILGNNSMLGVQLLNVGYGFLGADDRIAIVGDLIRNVIIERIADSSIKISNNITDIPAIIINQNFDRKALTLFNNSNLTIYLDVTADVSSSSYMLKLEPGTYWESPAPVYTGDYYAVVEVGSTAIDIREFV